MNQFVEMQNDQTKFNFNFFLEKSIFHAFLEEVFFLALCTSTEARDTCL